jgi:hypothetical protein
MMGAAHATHVDTIEQHRELRCVDLHALVACYMQRCRSAATL